MIYEERIYEEVNQSANTSNKDSKNSRLDGVFSHDEFYKKYILPDKHSEEWDKSVVSLLSNPRNLHYVLKKNDAQLNDFETNALFLINYFGSEDIPEKIKTAQINNLKNSPKVKDITIEDNTITITTSDDTTIRSSILSETFNWLAIDSELKTSRRSTLSHYKSLSLAKKLPFESRVVTGTITGLTNKSKYLHSWVEAIVDGKSVVIDYTMNSIMNKSGYYALRQATSLSKIDSYNLKHDEEITSELRKNHQLTLKEYLIYRDEIINALENQN